MDSTGLSRELPHTLSQNCLGVSSAFDSNCFPLLEGHNTVMALSKYRASTGLLEKPYQSHTDYSVEVFPVFEVVFLSQIEKYNKFSFSKALNCPCKMWPLSNLQPSATAATRLHPNKHKLLPLLGTAQPPHSSKTSHYAYW